MNHKQFELVFDFFEERKAKEGGFLSKSLMQELMNEALQMPVQGH